MRTEKELRAAKRAIILKGVAELYEQVEEDGIGLISLSMNFNEYNMGYKIDKSYKIGHQKEEKTSNQLDSKV
jgi:hypothetical protein